MTRQEFASVGEYISKLWPKWVSTPESNELWFDRLQHFTEFDVRAAIGRVFAESKYGQPKLVDIREALKIVNRENPKPMLSDVSPEHQKLVQDEEAEEDELLAEWSPIEREEAKAAILDHEPGMKEYKNLSAMGTWWTHLLCERFIHNRVIMYPGQVGAHKEGDRLVVDLPQPLQMSRDEWWDQLAKAKVQA